MLGELADVELAEEDAAEIVTENERDGELYDARNQAELGSRQYHNLSGPREKMTPFRRWPLISAADGQRSNGCPRSIFGEPTPNEGAGRTSVGGSCARVRIDAAARA